jgi:hypothetical protein
VLNSTRFAFKNLAARSGAERRRRRREGEERGGGERG